LKKSSPVIQDSTFNELSHGICTQLKKNSTISGSLIRFENSFGGIPSSRNALFVHIFMKGAAKPSAGNTWFCTNASQTFSGTLLNLTWLYAKASHTFSGTFSGTLFNLKSLLHQRLPSPNLLQNLPRYLVEPDRALHQSRPILHQKFLRNPVERDLALHQSLPDLLRNLLNLIRFFF
jgi:hypothetical protein